MRGIMLQKKVIQSIEQALQYTFHDHELLNLAFTHASLMKHLGYSNQRLEFLGDSVLSLVVSNYIYNMFPQYDEGRLTKMRADLVRQKTIAECIDELGVAKYVEMTDSEECHMGFNRASVKGDLFEAIVAAIFLDGGYHAAECFILYILKDEISLAAKGILIKDYKTDLQELVQQHGKAKITYHVIDEDHTYGEPEFTTEVWVNGDNMGIGRGGTKKKSQQLAAKMALKKLKGE